MLHNLLSHHESGYYRALPQFVTTRRHPGDHLIIWSVRGGLDATVGTVETHAGPGDLLVLEPGVPQRYGPSPDGDWAWFWVHYGGRAARELTDRIRRGSGPVVRFGFDEQTQARFRELVTVSADRRGEDTLRLDSCLYSLLGLIVERADGIAAGRRHPGNALAAVQEFINDRLADPLSLRDLVAHTGYSATRLSRLFRDHTGQSPMRYVNRQRMARAAQLLTLSTLTVAEIARGVGFPDQYHFSRRFKQATGYAPTRYRAINGPTDG